MNEILNSLDNLENISKEDLIDILLQVSNNKFTINELGSVSKVFIAKLIKQEAECIELKKELSIFQAPTKKNTVLHITTTIINDKITASIQNEIIGHKKIELTASLIEKLLPYTSSIKQIEGSTTINFIIDNIAEDQEISKENVLDLIENLETKNYNHNETHDKVVNILSTHYEEILC